MTDVRVRDAATVALLRDGPGGLEVLLVRRAAALRTHGGQWAFPGGAVDEADHRAPHGAEREAARRETAEEIGLHLDPADLVPFSHWTTPPGAPTIYRTSFFVAACPDHTALRPDPAEVAATAWHRPHDAHTAHGRDELPLPVPQFVTLHQLHGFADVAAVLEHASSRPPVRFEGRATTVEGGLVWRYRGDAAWEHGDLAAAGPRRRMWMVPGAWRYEEHDGTGA